MSDQIPPNDPIAERCVLKSMLADDRAHAIASEMLTTKDFYWPNYQLMFAAMKDNSITDAQVLRDWLKWSPGCLDALGDVLDQQCSPASIEQYCKIVLNCAAQRKAHAEAHGILQGLHQSPEEMAENLERAGAEIRERTKPPTDPVKELYSELDDAVAGKRYSAPMPWEMLARDTRALLPGTVTLIGGSPGSTKSLAIVQLIRHLRKECVPCALLALEDGVSYHLRRAAAQLLKFSDITDDGWCRANPEKVEEIKKKLGPILNELRECIEAPNNITKCTPDEIISWVRQKSKTCRVMAIDPITLMDSGPKPWNEDRRFLFEAKRIIEDSGSSLVLVTHPRKMPFGASRAQTGMDDLAGGVAWTRFSQTVMFLMAHDPIEKNVEHEHGAVLEGFNRTLSVFKARNGRGVEGERFAFRFDSRSLELYEVGKIRKGE